MGWCCNPSKELLTIERKINETQWSSQINQTVNTNYTPISYKDIWENLNVLPNFNKPQESIKELYKNGGQTIEKVTKTPKGQLQYGI